MPKSRKQRDEPGVPLPGKGEHGRAFAPGTADSDESEPKHSRAAPAPGVPLSDADYRRMKDEARERPPDSDDASAQEDEPEHPKH